MIKSVLEKEDSGSMVVHSLDQKETRGTNSVRKLLRQHRLP